MPSNHNYVCFACRISVRREKTAESPLCPRCGQQSRDLGYKIPVPAKDNERAWTDLRIELRESARATAGSENQARVAHAHELERQVARLEHLPDNPARARAIRDLRKRISDLHRH